MSLGGTIWPHLATPNDILVKSDVTHHFRVEFCNKSHGMGYF